ncbi:NAD(P)-dependent oxidoreductase [Companilactobacillus halodurans]|nr:NAD(P)H-binding protein [Companilactobacillus halodurans]
MVIGAYGKAGSRIIREAIKRGHIVIGIAHRKHPGFDQKNIIIKDMMKLDRNDIKNIDVIVDAVGAWTPETEIVHYRGLLHILQLIKNSSIHYLKVGGANTLYIDKEHQHTLQELPLYYPNYMQDLCAAHTEGLRILRTYSNVNWTYVTPTYNFDPTRKAVGYYHVDGEEFKPAKSRNPNDGINDYITYDDYAKGMLDIIEQNKYIHQRITLVSGNNPVPTQRY